MTTVTLYELADMRDVLANWLAETEGDVTPELEALLDELAGKTNEKIERVGLYIRELTATATAIEDEAKRLQARVVASRKAAEGLKNYLKRQMERLGSTKVDGLLCTVAIQKNGQPSVTTVVEPFVLYEADDARPYVKRAEVVTYTLDRERVLAAWKAAPSSLPAAIVVEQGTHIRVR
jgi:hypothetical protein